MCSQVRYTQASTKTLLTKLCLDPTELEPGESYDEGNAKGSPIDPSGQASFNTEAGIAANRKINIIRVH